LSNAATNFTISTTQNPSNYGNEFRTIAAISNNDIWAAGQKFTYYGSKTLIEHWNGIGWNIVSSPNPGAETSCGHGNVIKKMTPISTTDVWAVGYHHSCSLFKTMILHWNGNSWNNVVPPNPNPSGYNGVAAASSNDVWAVGYREAQNGALLTLIEHWDGSKWKVVASPNATTNANVLNAATAISSNNVWAVGYYYDPQSKKYETLVERGLCQFENVCSGFRPRFL
jgi:hypothetical protein